MGILLHIRMELLILLMKEYFVWCKHLGSLNIVVVSLLILGSAGGKNVEFTPTNMTAN